MQLISSSDGCLLSAVLEPERESVPDRMAGSGISVPNIVETIRRWATTGPDRRAITFLADSERPEESLTYAQMDREARSVAAWLQSHDLSGERVLLPYSHAREFLPAFLGCLYAGTVAVPLFPPRRRHATRCDAICASAQARAGLTAGSSLERCREAFTRHAGYVDMLWFASDTLPDRAEQWQAPGITPDTLAFLQYTSGSTADPRGVMVRYGNLSHNLEA